MRTFPRTTYPTTKAIVNYTVLATANLVQTLYGLDLQASIDGHRPNCYDATTRLNFATLQNGLFSIDRLQSAEHGSYGFGGFDVIFNGNPVSVGSPHSGRLLLLSAPRSGHRLTE